MTTKQHKALFTGYAPIEGRNLNYSKVRGSARLTLQKVMTPKDVDDYMDKVLAMKMP